MKLLGGKGRKVEMLQHFYENFLDPHKLQHCNKGVGEKKNIYILFSPKLLFCLHFTREGFTTEQHQIICYPHD